MARKPTGQKPKPRSQTTDQSVEGHQQRPERDADVLRTIADRLFFENKQMLSDALGESEMKRTTAIFTSAVDEVLGHYQAQEGGGSLPDEINFIRVQIKRRTHDLKRKYIPPQNP